MTAALIHPSVQLAKKSFRKAPKYIGAWPLPLSDRLGAGPGFNTAAAAEALLSGHPSAAVYVDTRVIKFKAGDTLKIIQMAAPRWG